MITKGIHEKKAAILRWLMQARNTYFSSEMAHYVYLIVLSTLLGAFAGLAAIVFNYLLDATRRFFAPENFTALLGLNRNLVIMIPLVGALIIAGASRLFPKLSKDRSVTAIIKSILLRNGYIPISKTVFHFFASIITIGTGAPLGPEAPAAKMGSGLGSAMSQLLGLGKKDMRMFTAAGAGAAISAIFNAPIAGVFFGIEVVLLSDLKNQSLSALIISSVVADIISRSVQVGHQAILIPHYNPGGPKDLFFFFAIGILCGITALTFHGVKRKIKVLIDEKLAIQNEFKKLVPLSIVFGFVITKYYSLFGIGYNTLGEVVSGRFNLADLVILLCLNIFFVALYVSAGGFGGTFAPALVMGIMLGYAFALALNAFFDFTLDPVTFALIAMGGVLSGINSIPLTAIMLVFETTGDYKFILPLMLVSIISYLVTIYYNKGTVYAVELLEEGIDVSKRREVDLLGKIHVADIMDRDYSCVKYETPFKNLVDVLLASQHGSVVVVNKNNHPLGIISLNDIKTILLSQDLVDLLIAGDIYSETETVSVGARVSDALISMEKQNLEILPVMDKRGNGIMVGLLTYQRIIQAYNRLLEEWETDQFMLERLGKKIS